MDRYTILFKATDEYISKQILLPLEAGFKKVIKRNNRIEKDLKGTLTKEKKNPPEHWGLIKIELLGTKDKIKKEQETIADSLTKLLTEYKNDPKIQKKLFSKFKERIINFSRTQLLKAYSIIGIEIEWGIEEDV